MSSVFSSPKVVNVQPQEVEPVIVDNSEQIQEIENRRKKKMGAVSQLLSYDNDYSAFNNGGGKTKLGA